MNYPTWSDLSNESIIPPLGSRQVPDIGPVALLVSCEPDMRLIIAATDNPVRVPFFNSTLITQLNCDKGTSVAGPFIGAPYAVMLLESLIARGAEKIIVVGWCGAVTDELNVGDIFLPSKAIVDEGTSKDYKHLDLELPVSTPDLGLIEQLSEHLTSSGITHGKGAIWTTDAIYRETKKKVDFFRSLGASAVEMECAALFSVAEYRKVSIAALLIVSDSVASRTWDPGFRNKKFKQARKISCEAIISFMKKLCENE
jgi:purine-nucleoside phosphorylase